MQSQDKWTESRRVVSERLNVAMAAAPLSLFEGVLVGSVPEEDSVVSGGRVVGTGGRGVPVCVCGGVCTYIYYAE